MQNQVLYKATKNKEPCKFSNSLFTFKSETMQFTHEGEIIFFQSLFWCTSLVQISTKIKVFYCGYIWIHAELHCYSGNDKRKILIEHIWLWPFASVVCNKMKKVKK